MAGDRDDVAQTKRNVRLDVSIGRPFEEQALNGIWNMHGDRVIEPVVCDNVSLCRAREALSRACSAPLLTTHVDRGSIVTKKNGPAPQGKPVR